MFSEATAQQPDSKRPLTRVPLPGDILEAVPTALHYLYKGCTVWLASTLVISKIEEAVSLAKFAHKYEIEPLLQACQQYLVQELKTVQSNNAGHEAIQLADLAETCDMRELLGHCEFVMISSQDSNLWTDLAMLSDQVSRRSLLRMLRAFQSGLGPKSCSGSHEVGRAYRAVHQPGVPDFFRKSQPLREDTALVADPYSDPQAVVSMLMSWNKS